MNKIEFMQKGQCPTHVADLVFDFLAYNKYELEESNIKKIEYKHMEICLDDGTKIVCTWNDYIMQVGFIGSTEYFEYHTVIHIPTMQTANFEPKILESQLFPVGVYTLLSNNKEKTILAANPYVSKDIIESEPDVCMQWDMVKKAGIHLNPAPVLQISKYSPDANISSLDQSQAAPLATETKPINLFINLNSYMELSTLYDTIHNSLQVTEDYMREYSVQKF